MILVPPRLARRHCGKASPHSGGTSSGSLRTALAVVLSMAFEGSRDSDLLNRVFVGLFGDLEARSFMHGDGIITNIFVVSTCYEN